MPRDLSVSLLAQFQVLEVHIVQQPTRSTDQAVQHLLVVAVRTVRRAKIDNDLAMALWAIATMNGLTHGGMIMASSEWIVGDRRH
jgi:hypothetical protein